MFSACFGIIALNTVIVNKSFCFAFLFIAVIPFVISFVNSVLISLRYLHFYRFFNSFVYIFVKQSS